MIETRATLSKPRRPPKLRANSSTGVYQLFFYSPGRTPERKSVSMGTRDRRQAARSARRYEDAWLEGKWDPWSSAAFVQAEPLKTAIKKYVKHKVDRGHWRERTADDRRGRLNRFMASVPPDVTVAMIRPKHIEAFLERAPLGHETNARNVLDAERLSPNAARTYHSQLKGFFAWCVASGFCEASPVDDVDRPARPPREEPVHLTPAQLQDLCRAVLDDAETKRLTGKLRGPYARQIVYLVDVFELGAYTGLRPAELRRLRWRDVDMSRGVLHVRHTALGRVKAEKQRVVPILSPARPVLERLAASRATENDDDTVLTSPMPSKSGKPQPISIQAVSRSFRTYARQIGLDGVSLYALRRTCATWLASNGAGIQVAQRVLGHASIRTTADFYASVWGETVLREADEAMRKALEASGVADGEKL